MIDPTHLIAAHPEEIIGFGGGGLGAGALIMVLAHSFHKKRNGGNGLTEAQATNLVEINLKAGDTNIKLDKIITLLEAQNRGN